MRNHVTLALAVALLVAAERPKEKPKADKELLQGVWLIREANDGREGVKIGIVGEGQYQMKFSGDKYAYDDIPLVGQDGKGTFTLDPSKKPKRIELKFDKKVRKGIYILKGFQLALC